MGSVTNPLLQIQFQIPFDQIRAEHVESAIDQLIQDAREKQRQLAELTGPFTFETTLGELEKLTETLDWAMSVVRHLEQVATYPELRAAYNAVQPRVSLFYTEIVLDPGLWRVLKAYAATDEAKSLSGARARLLKKTIDSFRRHGADLDDAGKARLKAIDVELAQLTTKFSENVLDTTNAWDLLISDQKKLAGLPPSAVDAARESAKAKGVKGWRFTLQAPSFNAVMTYLDDAAIRESAYRAFMTRATGGEHNNAPIIERILELRRDKAALLGYANFADLVLEDRMAHNGGAARRFVNDLRAKTEQRFRQETEELMAFRRDMEGSSAPALQPWDIAYYAEKQRAKLYDFDEEALRPYYPVHQVVSGMFELVQRLYGISVREQGDVPAWDPAVRYYWIIDSDGSRLGAFYADWYPRENKRQGAWMDSFITGTPDGNGRLSPHLGLICGNMTPPVADKPALLTHREVETIFHEFGHLLHHCLSRVEIRSLAGTNVAWDFVELPSQIMENWCWESESLDLFARHYQTGEPLPQDLFAKMKRARTFRAASAQMRQLGFATLDLALHLDYDREREGDVLLYAREISQPFAPAPLPADYGMLAGFTHLFSSPVAYASGYYSYKWAEVLDADAFTRFQQAGVFSADVGREFRDRILSRGDSEDPAELFRSFMSRDPDPDALLRRSGLLV
jgi:oligopeptidase A